MTSSRAPDASATTCFTIGHSNHGPDRFGELVVEAGLEVVVDVRSVPRSGYAPHFDQAPLRSALQRIGVDYVFLGGALGGRPADDACYDADGHVRYDRVAASSAFAEAMGRLRSLLVDQRVAVMCGEEDPTHCHRRVLVGRVLLDAGVDVVHVRGDGRHQPEAELAPLPPVVVEQDLFGDERSTWRSARPVRR